MPISRTPLNTFHTFESFVVCATNEAAFAAALDARTNPVWLHGRTGSGKSHLLHAIANDLGARQPEAN
ncbi:MAG TPA: DnaA/Hda family protein, partial [Thermoanaerobaculia bacterium]|nr:DnaA/Hda family protein [Thermoanaerobaculia bacterium]